MNKESIAFKNDLDEKVSGVLNYLIAYLLQTSE